MSYIQEQIFWFALTCVATVAVIPPIHAFGYWLQSILGLDHE